MQNISHEETETPILWRVVGEETNLDATLNQISLMSEYVLDSKQFKSTTNLHDNEYTVSDIKTFLNSFKTSEKQGISQTNTKTGMYRHAPPPAGEIIGSHQYTESGWVSSTYFPLETTDDYIYLPWGKYVDDAVHWTAGNDISEGKILKFSADNKATLKTEGNSVGWWLRSPSSDSYLDGLVVDVAGHVVRGKVNLNFGVRPAFKLNPLSVIFTSEVLANTKDKPYAPETDAYKLIVVKDVLAKTINTFDTTKESVKNGAMTLKTASESDSFAYSINLELLKELAKNNPNGNFVFDTKGVDYTMPFDITNKITGLSDYIQANKFVAKDLEIRLTMKKLTGAELEKAQTAYKAQFPNGKLVSDFYDISIELYDKNGRKPDVDCNKFDEKISFTIPSEKQGNAILVLNANNKFEFVQGKNGATSVGTGNGVVSTNHHSTYVVAKNNVTFSDVKTGSWYYTYVTEAANKALVAGIGALYQPDKVVTRAEFVQMVANALELPDYDKSSPKYHDVTSGWYVDSIMKAKSAGLLDKLVLVPADANAKEVPDMFFPNQAITREEMAYIIAKVADYEKIAQTKNIIPLEGKFTDYSEMNLNYDSEVQTVVRLNIMQGTSQTTFAPTGETTRAQAATVLVNMLSAFGMIE